MHTKTKWLGIPLAVVAAVVLTFATAKASAGAAQTAQRTTVTKFKTSGLSAQVFLVDSATGTTGFVEAGQDQTTDTVVLSFSYATAHPTDPDLVIVYQGADYIPNTALTIAKGSAHLALTTPDSFVVYRCVLNIVTAEFSCYAGEPITFDLTWASDGLGTVSEKTKRVETFGLLTTKYQAEYSSATATVSGTWDGIAGQDMAGHLLDTQNSTFLREVTMRVNP